MAEEAELAATCRWVVEAEEAASRLEAKEVEEACQSAVKVEEATYLLEVKVEGVVCLWVALEAVGERNIVLFAFLMTQVMTTLVEA
jgi:hypothetical protein